MLCRAILNAPKHTRPSPVKGERNTEIMTTITLSDAIVKALEAHNVQDVDTFVARAILHELEHMDEEDEQETEHELS
jgi:hypothetical protein